MALEFAKNLHHLILISRNKNELLEVKAEIQNLYNVQIEIIEADLSKVNEAQKIFEWTQQNKFFVEFLVNNAGIGNLSKFADVPYEKHNEIFQINMLSLSELCYLYIKPMLLKNQGGILNVSSLAAFQAGPLMSSYYASKAFVQSLTESLHFEYQSENIKIISLCPGPVLTGFAKRASFKEYIPKNQSSLVSPEELAILGYHSLMKNKLISIPRLKYQLGFFVSRFFSREFLAKLIFKYQSRRVKV